MRREPRVLATIAALTIAAALSGCGQRGPLTLPGDAAESSAPADLDPPNGDETADDEEEG